MDGIDAVLVNFDQTYPIILACHTEALPETLKRSLINLCSSGFHEIRQLAKTEPQLAEHYSRAANNLLQKAGLDKSQVRAIGSHGQTIRHYPGKRFTLQIGDPNIIAERTGITVVADFRRRDMAAGGQGAPLVPAFHKAVFSSLDEHRVILNIGGISNISVLPADPALPVTGFDPGPGNLLLDYWCLQHTGQPYDKNGQWAASASSDLTLLESLLTEPYFHQSPPKSTGRELFNPDWLVDKLNHFSPLPPATVQATLTELTAIAISRAIDTYAANTQALYVCGGGANNTTLMTYLQKHLPQTTIASTTKLGIDPQWVEATAFAWLACQTLRGKPGNLPDVTGASGLRILGGIFPAE
ncbi:Anhydro-N-acetylmuramic acid kinase [invertebrate metagenome]|uniref:Anhydro-N-acetylmuramic acid kinase n=1 Tax=invertebrate metagenome TaxID=1711999 RepID=A0A2H9TCG1_9ZZZZ